MLQELNTYDWASAFEYAGEQGEYCTHGEPNLRSAHPTGEVALTPFGREDVVEIRHIEEGENDGPDWVCVGRLSDGRWFALVAGCDYTGWDCQAGGGAAMAAAYEEVVRFGLSTEERQRLGVTLPGSS